MNTIVSLQRIMRQGHAVVTFAVQPETPVHQISIIPSGRGAGGYTLSIPKEDRSYMSKNDMQNEIVTLLAGRMAEKLIMGDISTGASMIFSVQPELPVIWLQDMV